MGEFDIINKYFAPLSAGFLGGLNLGDDAAVWMPPEGHELVITKDAISERIHFIGSEDASLIASKALLVNLSDLAAMGAEPICYFLALFLTRNTTEEWIANFTEGLKETQAKFGFYLAGGDTTATLGTLSISITMIGSVPTGKALRRNGAKIGDNIFVSGTLGDSAIGLELLQKDCRICGNDDYLISRYLTPQARISLGVELRDIATSCMDISDGLAQDLEHICEQSNVGAVIYADKIPLSDDAKKYPNSIEKALSGGDDYELLFTASPEKTHLIPKNCTKIGSIMQGKSVNILDKTENIINLNSKGYSHF